MFNKVMNNLIPYVILEVHSDNPIPYILPIFGLIEEYKLKYKILETLVEFVYDKINIDELTSVINLDFFWLDFYRENYIGNPPWQAFSIMNGSWEEIHISNEELFNALLEKKSDSIMYISDSDESHQTSETLESIIIDESDEVLNESDDVFDELKL